MTDFTVYNESLDSRDIIERIEELKDMDDRDADESKELKALKELADECEGCSDWEHGETLINVLDFESRMDEMIDDCYDLPELPCFMRISIDYDALRMDYMEVSLFNESYLIRCA